jgi:hypothetical protein
MIVVGAVDNNGDVPNWSQGGQSVKVWAPGDKIMCAAQSGNGWVEDGGTSFGKYQDKDHILRNGTDKKSGTKSSWPSGLFPFAA